MSPTLLGLSYDSLETIGDENRDEKEAREDTTASGEVTKRLRMLAKR